MNNTQLLETVYDILAQNTVDTLARDEVLRRIDHIDYDQGYIQFDNLRLQVIREGNEE